MSDPTIQILHDLLEGDDPVVALAATPGELGRALSRIHVELTRLRRREHELTVLFSSARDLAESRDLDVLLSKLVTRAHELLGTDITYLSEFDPQSRALHVRKTVGAVTPEFQHLRVPPGTGLASVIASSRVAQWTSRYDEYTGGPHDPHMDDAVAHEGIVSILGVPMLAEDTVLGVLFAATRHEHTFTAEETALLSALADHASIVVQTAAILQRLTASEEHARHAYDALSEHVDARDRSNIVHQQLIHAVLTGAGFSAIATTLAEALGRGVVILDAGAAVTACTDTEIDAVTYQSDAVQTAVRTSRDTGHCCFVTDPTSPIEVVAAVTVGANDYGALLLTRGALQLSAVEQRTIERAAQVCALLTLQHNAADDADRRSRAELAADLLDSAPERRRDLARRLRTYGITLDTLNTVVTVVVDPADRGAASRHLARLRPDAMVAEVGGLVALVTASSDPRKLGAEVHDALGALVICPPLASTPDDLPTAFTTSIRTAHLLDALNITDGVVDTAEYEIFAALFGHDPAGLHRFINATIGPVLDYDATHGTDLAATLGAFVRHDASPTKTARALSYHPNTIAQRLDRLKALLGEAWRTDERYFRISTAIRLHELRRL